ncbi:MAG TPA: SH3 domain-containing protein [Caulobacteraceae bacterium]|nr:SH3 domain-containing protein [Caulobacteraceae bacterium]
MTDFSGEAQKPAPLAKRPGAAKQGAGWRQGIGLGAGLAIAALGVACGRLGPAPAVCAPPARTSAVTGFCLPRWVSLKSDDVTGRKGPSADYPALWVYHARGLPVQIVAETEEWRRICDPDGGAAWVNRSLVAGRRTVMAKAGTPTPLRRSPSAGAPAAALLAPRALAVLEECRGDWCKVRVQGRSGWAAADAVWGTAAAALCR